MAVDGWEPSWMRLSPSKINTYFKCPREFYYKYIAKIPEKKTIAFGIAMDGYAAAMTAVASLTPESVEAADAIVEAAGRYVELQAEMRLPDQDSFVQAMKQVLGGGDSESGGQDIVLEMNGREFGRAVDAAINGRHSLKID